MLLGVDVSKWQGRVDWQKAKSAGAKFAFIRAGSCGELDGLPYTDKQFERNAQIAPDYMPIGFYWYFRPQHDPIRQADYFVDLIRNKRFKLPPVMDLEDEGAMDAGGVSLSGVMFAARIYQRLSMWPLLYSRAEWMNRFLLPAQQWEAMSIWIARYNPLLDGPWSDGKCKPKLWKVWRFWQWSARNGRGEEFGAESASIDLNFFNGDEVDLELYIGAASGKLLGKVKRNFAVSLRSGPSGPAVGATWKGATWPILGSAAEGEYYRVEAWIKADTLEIL